MCVRSQVVSRGETQGVFFFGIDAIQILKYTSCAIRHFWYIWYNQTNPNTLCFLYAWSAPTPYYPLTEVCKY